MDTWLLAASYPKSSTMSNIPRSSLIEIVISCPDFGGVDEGSLSSPEVELLLPFLADWSHKGMQCFWYPLRGLVFSSPHLWFNDKVKEKKKVKAGHRTGWTAECLGPGAQWTS